MARYQCDECNANFGKVSDLLKHRRVMGHNFRCNVCSKSFGRKDNLNRHLLRHVDINQYNCKDCGKVFGREDNLRRHQKSHHVQTGGAAENEPNPTRFKTDDPKSHYELTKVKETFHRKFNTIGAVYRVSFKDIEVQELKEILKALKKIFASLIEDITKFADDQDLLRMSVQAPDLDYPIELPFRKKNYLTVETFLSEIERVLQSYEEFVLDNGLEIDITHVKMPKGRGRKKCDYVNIERALKEKRCIIQIKNKDDLCCARAIMTAIAHREKHAKWESIRKGWESQGQLAKELHKRADVPLGKCSIADVKQFQSAVPEYQITVVSSGFCNGVLFCGPDSENKIYLYHHNDHFDVITSMPAFLNNNYYCTICHRGYDHKETHKCNNPCYRCKKIHIEEGDSAYCNDCNRYFNGDVCFTLLKKTTKTGKSTCLQYYRCECGQIVNKLMHKNKNEHICGNVYCSVCNNFFPPGHKCYMLRDKDDMKAADNLEETLCGDHTIADDDNDKLQKYIFFDFETTQEDMVQCDKGYDPNHVKNTCNNCNKKQCGSYEHHPNFCVAHRICLKCINSIITPDSKCDICGTNEHIFRGKNTRDDFCRWLFSTENKNAIAIAHNFRGFDSWPILNYLHENHVKPTVTPNGSKNMCIIVKECNVKMIDSLNFLPTALSKLPNMFGLSELSKGFWPHLYNKQENENVCLDHLPDVKYYNANAMKADDRKHFLQWYEDNKHMPFNFQHELLKYCRSDVDILRRCCLAFRELFIRISSSDTQDGIDPFQSCITIASACQRVFRRNFLKEETIAVIPAQGYKPENIQSKKALRWIKYISHIKSLSIQHAQNGGEIQAGKYKLDGYYETESGEKVALEYNGCFWHGCPKCFARDTKNPVTGMTMGEMNDLVLDKERYLASQGFKVITQWECDFDREIADNSDVKTYVDNLNIVSSLNPRDAFYGGRTEAFTLYKEATATERIKYYDVTSLYPFINKTGKYVIDHPSIITENFLDLERYEGLIKCKVLPPRGLLLPVLPCKLNNKLLFALCKICAETHQQTACKHTNDERAFIGTWVTDELKQAVKMGYIIQDMYEVWHFDSVEQYDDKTKTGGLFTGYVNTFLKIKQESSGWPTWCENEGSKLEYISNYYKKEGVHLEYNNIQKNSGLRSLAKLMLNSFWGKFGQRSNLQQIDYVSDPLVFYDLLSSDAQEVTHINFINDEIVEMRWKYVDEFVNTSRNTNVFIAAYTTAQARLKLYGYLETLGHQALYADTDSVIFSTGPDENDLPLGDYLGDLTDEVDNGSISCFVSGGPKNYAYKVINNERTETVCKVRGITLNYKNSLDINFETVKDMVTGISKENITVTDEFKIVRDTKRRKLLTTKQTKDYKVVFDKRVIMNDYKTLPYGY